MKPRQRALLSILICAIAQTSACTPSRAAHHSAPAQPARQIYEVSSSIQESALLKASGVAAYVVSSMGRNRGFLLKDVSNFGLASNIGMSAGDVLLQLDSHVITDAGDADRVLASIPSGTVRVMFVHPGDNGLQLYNGNVAYSNNSAGVHINSISSGSSSSKSHSGTSSFAQSKEISFSPECESYAVELINKDRKDHGSGAISANSNLTALARMHAMDMMKRNFFNHVNPDGEDPQARARRSGIVGGVWENISWEGGHENPATMIATCESRMMAEPPNQENHRFNILLPGHTCVGVGVCRQGPKVIMVQEFSNGNP